MCRLQCANNAPKSGQKNTNLSRLRVSGHPDSSLVSLFTPAYFGRMDPGPARRRRWPVAFTVWMAAAFTASGPARAEWMDVDGSVAVGLLAGYMVRQYADVRSAYPATRHHGSTPHPTSNSVNPSTTALAPWATA